jgi:RNA polymerase sigma-70 factor, ECF subfamily
MDINQLAVKACDNPQALEQLFELLYPRIYNYIRYRCTDLAEAEELVSQAFESLLAVLPSYNPHSGSFEPWVFAVVRNLVTSHYRSRSLRIFLPWEWFHNIADPTPTPEEAALLRETELALLAALPSLKPKQRDLLGLKYGSGFSNSQIAALTGLNEGNVAVILHRAVETLRQILNPKVEIEPGRSCKKRSYQEEAEHAEE